MDKGFLFKRLLVVSALFTLFLSTHSGCGLVQKVAVTTTSDLLFDATGAIEIESNWEMFKDGVPGNLKMMEGLVSLEPKNKKLLVGLAKGYAGYAFAVSESLSLGEVLSGTEDGPLLKQTAYNYSRALEYGLRFFELNDLPFSKLQESIGKDGGLVGALEKELDGDDMVDLEGVLFTAQSMGSLILMHKDDMGMISLLPLVKGMFDWMCGHKPDINFGACDIFYGAFEAGRPKALGGNPDKGREIFLSTINRYPHNWLMRIAYMRFYLIPMGDEEGFAEQFKFLEGKVEIFSKRPVWRPRKENLEDFTQARLLLYQSIALKQFEQIKINRKKLF